MRVFPNTILEKIDCVESLTGKCEERKTLSECIQLCEQTPGCSAGCFLHPACIPLEMSSDFFYRLQDKTEYPFLTDRDSAVFVSDRVPFPPSDTNTVFYRDNLVLNVLDTALNVSLTDGFVIAKSPVYVRFSSENHPFEVRNGDRVAITLPDTTYLLRNVDNEIAWSQAVLNTHTDTTTFEIRTDKKPLGSLLTYDDIVYFTQNQSPVVVQGNSLVILTMNTENAIRQGKQVYFRLIPKVSTYYKDGNVCRETTKNGASTPTYRSSQCWDSKTQPKKTDNSVAVVVIIAVAVLLLLVFSYCVYLQT